VLAALAGATLVAAAVTQLDAKCLTLQCRQAGVFSYWAFHSDYLLTENFGFLCNAGIVSEIGHDFISDIAS
jgi:hypothetical protein